ncbi:hypothetical protein J9978_16955, partial [Chromobacterium violaceum]|uniref:hypothetical protein n=1 Tax=Chromobacterium violaceum TaxID=536 RepID=UPI001B32C505
LSPSTYTYRLFVLLKSSADRCVVITGTVSFPLFRSLRQLRRRTIRPDPEPVNTFCEKNLRKMPILFQNRNNKLKRKHLC